MKRQRWSDGKIVEGPLNSLMLLFTATPGHGKSAKPGVPEFSVSAKLCDHPAGCLHSLSFDYFIKEWLLWIRPVIFPKHQNPVCIRIFRCIFRYNHICTPSQNKWMKFWGASGWGIWVFIIWKLRSKDRWKEEEGKKGRKYIPGVNHQCAHGWFRAWFGTRNRKTEKVVSSISWGVFHSLSQQDFPEMNFPDGPSSVFAWGLFPVLQVGLVTSSRNTF